MDLSEEPVEYQRRCPFREKTYCAATFESFRQMMAHCRQQHPELSARGEEPAAGDAVTDTLGTALSWEEIRRILDHPSFWLGAPVAQLPGDEEVA
jgi:hypothetical protein